MLSAKPWADAEALGLRLLDASTNRYEQRQLDYFE